MVVVVDMSPIPAEHTIWISVVLLVLVFFFLVYYVLKYGPLVTWGGR